MNDGLPSAVSALAVMLVAVPAGARSCNLYNSYGATTTLLTPLQPPATPDVVPNLQVTLSSGPVTTVAMDAGSPAW